MQSAKCIVHGAMMHGAMVHRGENEDHNVLQLSREARVCSCTYKIEGRVSHRTC